MSTLPIATATGDPGPLADSEARSWSEPYRRLRPRLSSETSYAVADQIVYSFGNMVVAALVSRQCGQDQFGIYILTQRTMDVLIQCSNVFLWSPLTFRLPGMDETAKAPYQGSIVILQIAFCAFFTGALWFGEQWARLHAYPQFRETFAPLVMASGGLLFREFTRRFYFAQLRLQEAFWTEVATVVLQIAGVGWLSWRGALHVNQTLWVLCGGGMLVNAWWVFRDARAWTVDRHRVWQDFRQDFVLGRWLFGSNMVFLASSQCNPWVLGTMLGGSAVGAYAICESLVNIPRVALTSMQNIMGPMLARAHSEGGRAQVETVVNRLNKFLLLASTLVAAATWVAGPFVARLIFHHAPGNARTVGLLLSVNLTVYASTLAQSYGLTAMNRANTTFYANAAGLLAQACICFFLIRAFQVAGAAMAMLMGSLVVLGVRQWFYRREVLTT